MRVPCDRESVCVELALSKLYFCSERMMGSRIAILSHNPVTKSNNIFGFKGFFLQSLHVHASLFRFVQTNIVNQNLTNLAPCLRGCRTIWPSDVLAPDILADDVLAWTFWPLF